MQIFRGTPDPFPKDLRGGVVTWGVFDGVHRGHVKVIDQLISWARELSAPSLVLTFDRHPAEVLRGVPVPLVCPLEDRVRLIGEQGVSAVIVLPFTLEFSRTTAEEFVRD